MAKSKKPRKPAKALVIKSIPLSRRRTANRQHQLVIPLGRKQLVMASKPAPRRPAPKVRHYHLPLLAKQLIITQVKSSRRPQPRQLVIPLVRPQTIANLAIIALGVLGAYYFGYQTHRTDTSPPAIAIATPPLDNQPKQKIITRSAPVRLKIPSIGVNTSFVKLGRQANGSMEVPSRFDVAGWYRYAPTPGEVGPAIIVGHVDNYLGPAVFWRLGELKAGDTVKITRRDGRVFKFKVQRARSFSQNNFPSKAVYGNIKYPGLRLITCGGQFDQVTRSYTHNTVVYAALIR